MNLTELPLREIEKFGEHISVIYEEKEFTNVELRRISLCLANALKKLGVQTLIFEMFFPGQRTHEQVRTRVRAFVEIMEQERFKDKY